MIATSRSLLMPVNRELSYECLKWADPKVYKMYVNLRYRGMTLEEAERDAESIYKLKMFILLNYELDELEANGEIEIINDHENEKIIVKNNNYNPKRDESEFVV